MRLRRGVFYVFLATFINLLVNIVSGFLLPKYLSVDTYAQITLYQLYITYVGLLHLGFSDGIYLKYGGKDIGEVNKENLLSELKTFKLFQLLITVVAIVICLFIKDTFLLLCAVSILPINISNYLRNVYQATGQFAKYARFTNINTTLILLVNLVLLFIIKSDYYINYVMAYIAVWLFYWFFLEWELRKIKGNVVSKFAVKYMVDNIKEGYALMLGNFSLVVLTSIDRLFVKQLMGLTQFAYYAFAVNLQSLINVFITPISTVMYNYFSKNREHKKVMLAKNVMLLMSAGLISGVFLIKIIVDAYLPDFASSMGVIFILFAAQFLTINIRTVFNNLYKVLRMQKRYLYVTLAVIFLALILVPSFFSVGGTIVSVAWAMLAASTVWFAICEYDFKIFRYSFNKYLYIILVLSTFLMSGLLLNSLTGLTIYVIVITTASYLLMKPECMYLLTEIVDIYKNNIKRKTKNL
jgi:O-antigen/teichoic acid export membrane protein